MADRPKMPVPRGELTPTEMSSALRRWAASQGYSFTEQPHGSEYAKVTVRDPAGGSSFTTIANAHKGRRLRRDQVRETVGNLNKNWRTD